MKDKLGQEIRVGNFIAYGTVLGRSGAIQIGKVLKLDSFQDRADEPVQYRIQVRGIDDHWKTMKPRLMKRNGTLLYPERIIVLQPEQVPTAYWTLLEGA